MLVFVGRAYRAGTEVSVTEKGRPPREQGRQGLVSASWAAVVSAALLPRVAMVMLRGVCGKWC